MAGVLVVTGGSRGIGAAVSRQAATRGYGVCINYNRSRDAAERIAGEIVANGGRAIAVRADTADEGDVVRLFDEVDLQLGTVTALVNNAGILDRRARVEELTAERINRILAVNVTGYFLCAREAVRRMSTRHGGPGGAIVNVSSAAARLGSANEFVDYAASKGATDTFTTGLAIEVADEGIRVNAVRPGLIQTDIHDDSGIPDRVGRLVGSVPMRRAGAPEEVAEAILWLLSDAASYVTGTFVDISGGR